MKKKLILIILFFNSLCIFAQQFPQYSLYMLNPHALNPAYAGLDGSLSATAMARKQWTGLEGSPTGALLDVHLPVDYINSGFGLRLENDALGAQQRNSVQLSYAYHIQAGEDARLSFGLRGIVRQHTLDGSKLRTPDGNYEGITIDHQDVILPNTSVTTINSDVGAGVYFRNNRLEIGAAADNILKSPIKFSINGLKIKSISNYFFTFAYQIPLSESLTLQPAALIKSDLTQTQSDISLIINYQSNIFAGASLRGYNKNSLDAVVALVGFQFSEHWRVAYSYDVGISALKTVQNGSHEILLGYNLRTSMGKALLPPIIFNPRF